MLSRWMSVIFDYAISMKNVSTVWKQRHRVVVLVTCAKVGNHPVIFSS